MLRIVLGGALAAMLWAPPAFSQSAQDLDFYSYLGGAASGGPAVPFIGSGADGATFLGWTSGGETSASASGTSEPSGASGSSAPQQMASAAGEALPDGALARAAMQGSSATGTQPGARATQ